MKHLIIPNLINVHRGLGGDKTFLMDIWNISLMQAAIGTADTRLARSLIQSHVGYLYFSPFNGV